MGFYVLMATLSFIIQLVVLGMLIISFVFKRQKKFFEHGYLMLTSVILHLAMVFIIMIPSFNSVIFIESGVPLIITLLNVVHGIPGVVAIVMSLWLLTSWRLRDSLQYCAPKRKIMRATYISWLTAVVLGLIIHFIYYVPTIF